MSTLVNQSRPRNFFWRCPLKSKPVYWSLGGYYLFSSDSPGKYRDTRPGEHKFSKKSRSHLKVPGARFVKRSKFHTEDPQTLGGTAQNLMHEILCVLLLEVPQSRHDLFLPNILQFTVHHWRSKVWHTDRVLKPATNLGMTRCTVFVLKLCALSFFRINYAFIFSLFLKRSGRKVDGLHPSSTEIKNARSYTSVHPHTFMARCFI